MHDANSIESINCEQLVTATDRWLIRNSRGPVPRAASFRTAAHDAATLHARAPRPARDRHGDPRFERTATMRTALRLHAPSLAIGVAIPSLFGIAAGITAML